MVGLVGKDRVGWLLGILCNADDCGFADRGCVHGIRAGASFLVKS